MAKANKISTLFSKSLLLFLLNNTVLQQLGWVFCFVVVVVVLLLFFQLEYTDL